MKRYLTLMLLSLLASASARAQVCTSTTNTFLETFSDTTYKDPASAVDGWGPPQQYLTLGRKGLTFAGTSSTVGQPMYVVTDADLDNDGWTDLVALLFTPGNYHLHFLRNLGTAGSPAVHQGFDAGGAVGSSGFNKFIIDDSPVFGTSSQASTLVSGDFDGDGDKDVLYIRLLDQDKAGAIDTARMYRYTSFVGGSPKFDAAVEIKSDLTELNWHWMATAVQAVDWNQDGFTDLVGFYSADYTNRVVVLTAKTDGSARFNPAQTLIADTGFAPAGKPIASSSRTATACGAGGCACPPAVSRGPSMILVNDFDGDGDRDVIAGSVSYTDLHYWKNDGAGNFTRQADIPFAEGGASAGVSDDFDRDGDVDLMVGRDGKNCNGAGGTVWFFGNDGDGNFTKRTTAVVNVGADLDFGVSFNIDNDAEDRPDAIFADGNDSGNYYKVLSSKLDIFNLEGTAISKPIDTLTGASEAIVNVRITSLDIGASAGCTGCDVTFYVSNDDGVNWEEVTADELPPLSNYHYFRYYGSQLRFKAELTTTPETLTGDEAVFMPASKKTPTLDNVGLSYDYVTRRRYSRSSLAYFDLNGASVGGETLVSASYYFPGFEATLLAYDMSALTAPATGLERIDDQPVVTVLWNAGARLAVRPALSRDVYAACGPTSCTNGLLPYLTTNCSTGVTPNLLGMMAADEPTCRATVNWVRGATGAGTAERPWKLFDVGHSSPVYVGPPRAADAEYLANGYATFAAANTSRTPLVLIGANDGMLHAFDASTGDEAWAIIPHNLVAKAKLQRVLGTGGVEEYVHDYYVDGPVVVRDVFDFAGSSGWRTVAFVGQALGRGLGDDNYYFAVDVTDPSSPRALWELTDGYTPRQACSGTSCTTTCVDVCTSPPCDSSCTNPEHRFTLNASNVIGFTAEHYNSTNTLSNGITWQSASGSGITYMRPSANKTCSEAQITAGTCGAVMSYNLDVPASGTYRVFARIYGSTAGDDDFIFYGTNGALAGRATVTSNNSWHWVQGSATITIGPTDPEPTFQIWQGKNRVRVDAIVLKTAAGLPTAAEPEVCSPICPPPECTPSCTSACLGEGDEWPECGVGEGKTCCPDATQPFCAPIGTCASTPTDIVMGETWSPPVVGKVKLAAGDRYVVFFGSGYNNHGAAVAHVGRTLYVVDAINGSMLGSFTVSDLAAGPTNPSTIDNTLPGGGTLVDLDGDGYVDRLYIGDLEGRLWRLSMSGTSIAGWDMSVIFDAADVGANRAWAPIITKPAVVIMGGMPYLYFGTGGDERAPDSLAYRFYAVRDDPTATVTRKPSDLVEGDLEFYVQGPVGYKHWSDPLIVNNSVVYFAALYGSIESVDPCASLIGPGGGAAPSKIYGYAIRQFTDAAGTAHAAGTAVTTADSSSKVRQAMVLRGEVSDLPVHSGDRQTTAATDILVQGFSAAAAGDAPPVSRLAEVGLQLSNSSRLRILFWREVPLE